MRMKLISLLLFLGLILFPLALADQTAIVCKFVPNATLTPVPGSDIPLRQTAYSDTINIPKFDPGLGVLDKVYLTIDACGNQSYKLDNEDPQLLSTFTVAHSGLIRVTVPVPVPDILEVEVSDTSTFSLPPDNEPNDGDPDFVGTDSYSRLIRKCSDAPANEVYDQPSDLAAFTASVAGIPEIVSLDVNASGEARTTGNTGNYATSIRTYMGAKVCVVYEYRKLCINGTKINNCTENGLPGWTINLRDASGAVIRTAVTDANGDYSFCELLPGNYEVCETPQASWIPVGPTCIPVTLVDVDFQGVDFRNEPLLCIEGFKYNSIDDSGLPGWTIELKDSSGAVINTTVTGANGEYSFCDLVSGTYTVCEVMKAGWMNVTATCVPVTLDCVNVDGVNFENTPLLCIEGSKINDCTEEGLPGWTIELKDSSGAVINTTVTGANGEYSFCELLPGNYEVCETPQAGWIPVGPTCIPVTLVDVDFQGVDFRNEPLLCIEGFKFNSDDNSGLEGWTINLENAAGSIINTTTTDSSGKYSFCNLVSGTYTVCEVMKDGWKNVTPTCVPVTLDCVDEDGVNFENEEEIELCINGSKINDCTEEGLPGWTIELKDSSGAVIKTAVTGANGEYSFCELLPGNYEVCETPQAGWKPVGSTCIPVPLTDETVEGVDFRNTPPFCISGYKFNNETDLGLSGWTIELKDATGTVIDTRITGTDGYYEFCGLFSGTYKVCEVLQPGWTAVGPTCFDVTVDCADEPDINFRNKPTPPPVCGGCPWYLNNDAYRTQCGVTLEVDASRGILANDREGAWVIDPHLITIDPKYGTLDVEEDGSFVFEPALKYPRGTVTLSFNYRATDGICAANGQGTAKISVTCR